MTNYRQKFGSWGETLAVEYLLQNGYLILDRNVRNRYGEVDIVASYQNITVFVEVKTRSTLKFGHPEQAVSDRKQIHFLETAQQYLVDHPSLSADWRVDVIAILHRKGKSPEITHFENAFS